MELKFRYHPGLHPKRLHGWSFAEDRTATWKSYFISNQDPIPHVRNYCYERERESFFFFSKETESSAAETNHSRIEETHATQESVPAHPVYCVKETIPMGERTWIDILANKWHQEDALSTEIAKLVMRLGRHHDQDEREVDGAVHWDSMGPQLRNASLKYRSSEFSDLDWL